MKVNQHYQNLQQSYLFSEIAKRINAHKEAHPQQTIYRLGIGDVTLPLAPAVIEAMQSAVAEMSQAETFRGYGEEQGYAFLREAVSGYYEKKEVCLQADEIFISDGAKSDVANILDIMAADNVVLVPNPVYPVYVDTNVMHGRTIIYGSGTRDNNFLPMPEERVKADIIYLCSPNNPTGAVYNRDQLKAWVDYAMAQDAVILFDSAYEVFVSDPSLPTSIYEIEGAKSCAIEFCSLSKTAGFTGTRCGYTVVPHELVREGVHLNRMWLRRQTTKFNGVPYIVQRGAEAVFSKAAQQQIEKNINYYMSNAKLMSKTMTALGIWHTGGENSPYIWLACPNGMSSWEFFDYLLSEHQIVGTPGAGFGENGEGYFRFSAFGSHETTKIAMEKLLSDPKLQA